MRTKLTLGGYDIYQLLIAGCIDSFKVGAQVTWPQFSSLHGQELEDKAVDTILEMMVSKIPPVYMNGPMSIIDFEIVVNEYWWKKSGSWVLFPEDKEFLEYINKIKYMEYKFPYKSFILAVPENFVVDGSCIRSCLVTVYDQSCLDDMIMHGRQRLESLRKVNYQAEKISEQMISISYLSDNADGYILCIIPVADLHSCFEKGTVENVRHDPYSTVGVLDGISQPSTEESRQLAAMLKVACNLLAYIGNVEPDVIEPGSPNADAWLLRDETGYEDVSVRTISHPKTEYR